MGVTIGNGKRVLVVDDVAAIRLATEDCYKQLGFEVVACVENGVEALKFLDTNQVDLVSLDIIMPEMDGIECYRKIRQRGLDCRCVFISWLAADARIPEALSKEIPQDLFQAKPINVGLLKERLAKVFALAPGYVPAPTLVKSEIEDVSPDELDAADEGETLERKPSKAAA